MPTVLIVDDEPRMCGALKLLLEAEGFEVKTAHNGVSGMEILKNAGIDIVITDVRMPKIDGIQLLKEIKGIDPIMPVIVMTAYANLEDGIHAMKEGAYHYLTKPFDNEEVKVQVRKALEERRLRTEIEYLRKELDQKYPYKNIIGKSPGMNQVFELVRRVAPAKSTVLITGDSGTGKELIARAIHDNSTRREKPMIKVNCASIPPNLLESELFGHMKGAFTDAIQTKPGKFELAHEGTIFLDEIGDMSQHLQAKILRVLQEREFEPVGGTMPKQVDVRVIAATNRPLRKLVNDGKFREDLYFRLNVVQIHIPPLRERKEDIPDLIQYFLNKSSHDLGKEIHGITPPAFLLLQQYDYPGNVRELENMIERAVVLCTKSDLDVNDFQFNIDPQSFQQTLHETPSMLSYRDAKRILLEDFEKKFFIDALKSANGNITKAAEMVGMHRKNLYEKLDQYKINPQDYLQEGQ